MRHGSTLTRSADGTRVGSRGRCATGVAIVFASDAGDLVVGDTNGFIDVFLATDFR